MARKRLNKKVALIGSVVFVFLVFLAIAVVLYLSRDPQKFIKDGDAASKLARAAATQEDREQQYKRAARNYGKAQALAESDELRVQVLFKLAQLYRETGEWQKVRGCWSRIIQLEPDNIEARLGNLHFHYVLADSSANENIWRLVQSEAEEFLGIVREKNLERTRLSRVKPFEVENGPAGAESLRAYLYLTRGRASSMLAQIGVVTEPMPLLEEAINDLEKVKQLEPKNIDVYWYLAQAVLSRGDLLSSMGDPQAASVSLAKAEEYLNEAIEVTDADVQAQINLLRFKRSQIESRDQIESLRDDYAKLSRQYQDSSAAYIELAQFYQMKLSDLDKAVQACEHAIEKDKDNISYLIQGIDLHYRRFLINSDRSDFDRSIELAQKALQLPQARETTGPLSISNRGNRVTLYFFLANCYINEVLENESLIESEREEYLVQAEQAVHEIEQLFGSGENPYVIRWKGMLELAKGNTASGIRQMNSAYERLKASGIEDSTPSYLLRSYGRLSYALARHFKNSSEKGAVLDYLSSSLTARIYIYRPYVILDFAEANLEIGRPNWAMANVDFYEENYGASARSKALRIRGFIAGNQLEDAKNQLSQVSLPEAQKIILEVELLQAQIQQIQRSLTRKKFGKSEEDVLGDLQQGQENMGDVSSEEKDFLENELDRYRNQLALLSDKILKMSPDFLGEGRFISLWQNYVSLGQKGKAKLLVDTFLQNSPDNVTVAFYGKLLGEPEPTNLTLKRRVELEEEVLSDIPDPVARRVNLGILHKRNGDLEKAAENFKKVLNFDAWKSVDGVFRGPSFEEDEVLQSRVEVAAGNLFEIALEQEDWSLGEKVADIARLENLDGCEGEFYSARLSLARSQYEQALTHIEKGLELRPVFSMGYMLRSSINSALVNESAAIEDAREARTLNPRNPRIAKRLALLLYQRNQRLGKTVTSAQQAELRTALDKALALNPADMELLNFYAEYISNKNPELALSLRQYLYSGTPTTEHALLLGSLAVRIAKKQDEGQKQEAVLDIAGSAYEDALKMSPNDQRVVSAFAEYYRLRGKDQQAQALIEKSQDKRLLWWHYYHKGEFSKAREVLEELYADDPSDSNALRGLLLITRETGDEEGVKRFAQKLVSLEDNVESHLLQIQTYLQVGLVQEAALTLESFKERFPDELRILLLEGWLQMRKGRLTNALASVNRYLERNQDNAEAWKLRGKIHYLMANYREAIDDFNMSKSIVADPYSSLDLARCYMRLGQGQEAIMELQAILNEPQVVREVRKMLAEIYQELGRDSALMSFYDSLLSSMPENVRWRLEAGSFASEQQKFEKAERLYREALELSDTDRDKKLALDGYLGTLVAAGRFNRVFEEGAEYVNGKFGYVALLRMAEAKKQAGDIQGAMEYGRTIFEKIGVDELLSTDLMERISRLLGEDEVLNYWKDRIAKEPDSTVCNLSMYDIKFRNEEYNQAYGYIQNVIEQTEPSDVHRIQYIAEKVRTLQNAYLKTSDNSYLQKVVKEYESLLSEQPNNAMLLNNLAYLLADVGRDLDRALNCARKAYERMPTNPMVLETYAFVLFKNGDLSQAQEVIHAALQHYEDSKIDVPAEVYEHLGMIEEANGFVEPAVSAYQLALDTGGLTEKSESRIKEAIERLSK